MVILSRYAIVSSLVPVSKWGLALSQRELLSIHICQKVMRRLSQGLRHRLEVCGGNQLKGPKYRSILHNST